MHTWKKQAPAPPDPELTLAALATLPTPLALLTAFRDADGAVKTFACRYANDAACAFLGAGPEDLVGRELHELLPPDIAEEALERCRAVVASGRSNGDGAAPVAFLRDGSAQYSVIDYDIAPIPGGVSLTWRGAGGRGSQDEGFDALIEHAADAILVVSDDGEVLVANGEAERLFGRGRDRIIGDPVESLLPARFRTAHGEHRAAFARRRARRPMGVGRELLADTARGEVPVEVSLVPLVLGGERATLATVRDVSERHRLERELRELADHDPLTGLFNRRRFEEELVRHLALATRYDTSSAVLLLDLDTFKDINDTLGHTAGDAVLRDAADLLRGSVRASDVIARLGGDEFVILLPFADEPAAMAVAQQIKDAIASARLGSDARVNARITVSIGVFIIDHESAPERWEDVMSSVDIALYAAKEDGRNRAVAYHPELHQSVRVHERVLWSQRLHDALEGEGLELFAQPILATDRPDLRYVELLLRMRGPSGGLHTPDQFLPIAAQVGLMRRVDNWVIRQAFRLSRRWPDARLAVNLSAESMAHPGLVDEIAELAHTSGADLTRIVFELTETAAVTNLQETAGMVRRLRSLGCSLALDDFGAGFGSFSYVKHLPFDQLKIDGAFVRRVCTDPADQVMVQAMVHVARGLNKELVAEWVGDEDTIELLAGLGITLMQGYAIGEPRPIADVLGDG